MRELGRAKVLGCPALSPRKKLSNLVLIPREKHVPYATAPKIRTTGIPNLSLVFYLVLDVGLDADFIVCVWTRFSDFWCLFKVSTGKYNLVYTPRTIVYKRNIYCL